MTLTREDAARMMGGASHLGAKLLSLSRRFGVPVHEIPLSAIFISEKHATPADIAWARGVAEAHGWV